MLNYQSTEGLDAFINLYNKIWQHGLFPGQWLKSKIIPILKPEKDSMNPSNYCLIALTCVLCKIMEKSINVRPSDYFDHKGIL